MEEGSGMNLKIKAEPFIDRTGLLILVAHLFYIGWDLDEVKTALLMSLGQ